METVFDQSVSHPKFVASALSKIEDWCLLVFNRDKHVRMKIAENPRLPRAAFGVLAKDESHDVRITVADNPLTPISLLEQLARDEHPDVRYAMAENANMPQHILHLLTDDDNPYVAARASRTLNRLNRQMVASLQQCAQCA